MHNMLLAVCPARACRVHAASLMDASKKKTGQKFGLDSAGPEMLMCRNCYKLFPEVWTLQGAILLQCSVSESRLEET